MGKKENLYVSEFIEYYFNLGFDTYLYMTTMILMMKKYLMPYEVNIKIILLYMKILKKIILIDKMNF